MCDSCFLCVLICWVSFLSVGGWCRLCSSMLFVVCMSVVLGLLGNLGRCVNGWLCCLCFR